MSDDQFSQLQGQMTDFGTQMTSLQGQMTGLQGQMTTVQDRMDGIENRMDGFDMSLARMYTYMEKRFDRLEETKADKTGFNRIYDQLDGLIKRIDEDRDERLAANSQLNRHERWHHQTADHLGLKLD